MRRGDALRGVALLLALSSRQKDRYVPEFSKQIAALDKRAVKLKGFMLPLEQQAAVVDK